MHFVFHNADFCKFEINFNGQTFDNNISLLSTASLKSRIHHDSQSNILEFYLFFVFLWLQLSIMRPIRTHCLCCYLRWWIVPRSAKLLLPYYIKTYFLSTLKKKFTVAFFRVIYILLIPKTEHKHLGMNRLTSSNMQIAECEAIGLIDKQVLQRNRNASRNFS